MELKRLLNIKYIIIVCAALVLNIILFMFQATAGGNKINEDSKRDLRIRTEYIENYKSNIQNIVDRAEKLKKQRLFSNPESFSYKNIRKTGKDYEKLININLSADNSKAVRAISKYSMFIGISAILTLLLMNNLFKERDNNMWQLTYMSKNGRAYLGLVRIADIFIISLIQHCLLYITVVCVSFILFGGLGDLYNPIQNISEFGQCTLVINKAEYLIADFLLTYLSVVVATSIIYMLMNVFRNRKNVSRSSCPILSVRCAVELSEAGLRRCSGGVPRSPLSVFSFSLSSSSSEAFRKCATPVRASTAHVNTSPFSRAGGSPVSFSPKPAVSLSSPPSATLSLSVWRNSGRATPRGSSDSCISGIPSALSLRCPLRRSCACLRRQQGLFFSRPPSMSPPVSRLRSLPFGPCSAGYGS